MTDEINGKLLRVVPKAAAEDENKSDVLDILRATLAEAERGEIESVSLIISRPDGTWTHRTTPTKSLTGLIGKLEIAAHDLIKRVVEGD